MYAASPVTLVTVDNSYLPCLSMGSVGLRLRASLENNSVSGANDCKVLKALVHADCEACACLK